MPATLTPAATRARRGVYALAAVIATFALCLSPLFAPSAVAAQVAVRTRTFGSFANARGIALDQASGDSLIADSGGSEVVYVFGPEGEGPVGELKGAPGESFSFQGRPVGVAVDNDPASASYRDVYVTDVKHNHVDKFTRNGSGEYEYACQIDGWNGAGNPACTEKPSASTQPFEEPVGATVDSHGDVYISSYGPTRGFVAEFDPAGNGVMQLNSAEHELLDGHPYRLAVDSGGDLFVENFREAAPALSRERLVVKFSFSSPGVVSSENVFAGPAEGIALDPATDGLYVDSFASILERYTPTGEKLATPFESFPLEGGRSLAVRDTTATPEIYLAGSSQAEVLGTITLPDVDTCGTSGITATTAHLEGSVDPLSAPGAVARFQYKRIETPEQPGETLETPFEEVEGDSFVPVAAEVTELTPGSLYRCRLQATDSAGIADGFVLNEGEEDQEGTFETPPELPAAFGVEASDLTPTSVLFTGEVAPGNGATTYRFEYGTTPAYGTEFAEAGLGSGFAPVAVERTNEAPLEPGTTYHYALIAKNASGQVVSEDHTFTTPPASPEPLEGGGHEPPPPGEPPALPSLVGPPATPLLLAAPPIAFPTTEGALSTPHKTLTRAQKLRRALAACRKLPKRKRPACDKRAEHLFGAHHKPKH